MYPKIFKTKSGEVWQDEYGIIRIKTFPNAQMNLDDAKEGSRIVDKLSKGKGSVIFIDMREAASMDRESRKYYSELESNIAVALLVESPLSKVIGNFFVGLNKTSYPLKIFSSDEKALDWLKGFLQ
jgi:hypothetical protein